jgi:hypothetical protein
MFKIIDDTFINTWNMVHSTYARSAWLTQVQTQLSNAVPAHFECTEAQEVEIRVTQQWLQSIVWQRSVYQGPESNVPNDNALPFSYAIEIAKETLARARGFSQQHMKVHGVGLVSNNHTSYTILCRSLLACELALLLRFTAPSSTSIPLEVYSVMSSCDIWVLDSSLISFFLPLSFNSSPIVLHCTRANSALGQEGARHWSLSRTGNRQHVLCTQCLHIETIRV